MKRRNLLVGCVALLVICAVVAGVGWVLVGPAILNVINAVAAANNASNVFMNTVIAKDFTKAYGMVHPSQQTSFGGSPDQMKQLFTSNDWIPSSFTSTNAQAGTDAIVNGTGNFGGTTKYVEIDLRKDGDTWKILGFRADVNPPTVTPSS